MTRSQAIARMCRECIHDPRAAGTWREQTAVCGCVDCPLWKFRPLPRNRPQWIAQRDPKALPDGFARLHHTDALARLRENIDATLNRAPVFHARLNTERGGATPVARQG